MWVCMCMKGASVGMCVCGQEHLCVYYELLLVVVGGEVTTNVHECVCDCVP